MTIKELQKIGCEILNGKNSKNNKSSLVLDSRLILQDLLNIDSTKFYMSLDESIESAVIKKYKTLIRKRARGYSLHSVLGKKNFYGLTFHLNKSTLVPRFETELLCESAVEYAINLNKDVIKILDICTGCGTIGITVAKELSKKNIKANLILSDISKGAMKAAKINAENIGVDATVMYSNLFDNINNNEKFDIICANPPYIDKKIKKSLSEEVRHEASRALFSSNSGFSHIKRILKDAKKFMNEDSMLFIEFGYDQGEKIINCAKKNSYKSIEIKKDLQSFDRYAMIKI